MDYVVEMREIRKEFPGVVACDDINFQVKKGEIHALLGENGAGKSTLMNILFGLYQPDNGEIYLHGKKVNIANPNVANDLGIGMVHQHFKLVHNFTVTENIILGLEPTRAMMIDIRTASARIRNLSKQYGLNVDPDAKISDVSVGMQQRVEILKMLYRNAEILIFDEPTAVLTPQEVRELMKIMRSLIDEGKTIILITHKLREIMAIADRCTVIRWGKFVGTVKVSEVTEEKLAEMMVGRKILFEIKKNEAQIGDEILSIENLSVLSGSGALGLKNFSLGVKCGEIVGLAGVDGNGQAELVEAIIGLRSIESGKIIIHGTDVSSFPVRKRISKGMAHIPDDRHKHGLILDYTVQENLVLKNYYLEPFSRRGFLNWDLIREHASRVIKDFDVRAGEGPDSSARSLSGGNQQKAIVGREIDGNPEILIAVQPTRGLDVGAIEYIHRRLIEQRDQGKAVLLISLELDEILDLSDRIAVINSGELVGLVNAAETNENEIGLMMAGVKRGATA
ncbi:MAG: ABC transporter ATP-binding protein [Bacillota bacterium]